MSSRSKISELIQSQVRQRSSYLCEYCHASEQWQYVRFTVDHVVPLSLGGANSLENLALACFHCNRRKTNRLTAVDPQSNEEVLLFNPRQQVWPEHFIWSRDGLLILGLTSVSRATIAGLALNRERVIYIFVLRIRKLGGIHLWAIQYNLKMMQVDRKRYLSIP